MATAGAKKLFLIDAMAHVYRAFYAPMVRMNAPSGMPTKVPFLFNNILRRLIKDYQPDYIGVVFDTSKPTFRDKLFEKYKAARAPMPDELSQQRGVSPETIAQNRPRSYSDSARASLPHHRRNHGLTRGSVKLVGLRFRLRTIALSARGYL